MAVNGGAATSDEVTLQWREPLLDHEQKLAVLEDDGDGGGGSSVLRTCFNGLNALSGVGILSIPYALAQGGWLSLALLFAVSVVCYYTGLLLQRCMNASPEVRSYPDIGHLAFGSKGRLAVSAFMYLELYLVAIGFLILEGDNLDKLLPNATVSIAGVPVAGKQLFVVLFALIVLPTTWLRRLGVLAYVSAGGVFASVILIVCVLWAATVDGVGFQGQGRALNVAGLPNSLGLYTFCYCGHAIFPTLCNSMKNKTKFSKVLVICFVLCTINYGSMAVLGYLMYGDNVESQVTLNLPLGKISSKIAIYTTLINPFSKYALMVSPVATAIEQWLLPPNKRFSATMLVRSLVVLSTVVVALAIPFFGSLMTLVGALLSIVVSMVLPCICYMKIFRVWERRRSGELAAMAGILAFSSVVAVTGTYSSLMQIIHQF